MNVIWHYDKSVRFNTSTYLGNLLPALIYDLAKIIDNHATITNLTK